MTPEAVQAKYGVPPERYSDLAALVGESSDNLPGVPGVGPKTAAKWINQYGDLDGVVAHVDQIKGKAGESLREHLDGVLRNRRLNQLVSDVDRSRSSVRRPRPASLGPRRRSTRSSTGWSSGCCATGSSTPSRRSRRRPSPGSTSTAACSPPRRCRLARRARGARRARWASTWSARGPAAPVTSRRSPWPRPAAPRPTSTLTTLDQPAEESAGAPGWVTPRRPKALHDAKGPLQALAARGLPLARHHQRHGTGRLPGPARPALLRPGRPRAAPPAAASCASDADAGGQGVLDFSADGRRRPPQTAMVRARAVLDLAVVARRRSSRPPAVPRCCATSSCRSSTCWPAWSASASPSTSRR